MGDGRMATAAPPQWRVERDEPKAQALLVLDVAGCHARQRHHDDTSMDGPVRYTFYQRANQEQEGPVKLRSPLLVRAGSPDPPVPCDRRSPSPRLSARHLETFGRPRGVVWRQSPNKGLPGLGAKRWVLPPHGRSAASGEKKFDLSETVTRFGDILIKVRPIIEIGPRSVFGNSEVGGWQ